MAPADGDVRWEAPGPGQWYLTKEHFPRPVSRLFATLFPPTTMGWPSSERRYGLPERLPRWAAVNAWLYYSPSPQGGAPGSEPTAAEVLREERWRDDIRRWHDVDRPRIVAANLALQGDDVTSMDDEALTDHLRRAMGHFGDVGQLHFELHTTLSVAGGLVVQECSRWGIDPVALAPLLAGASPASAAAQAHVDRIAHALAGRAPTSLVDIQRASREAAAAVDAYLAEYGWRCLDQHELRGATLIERPDIVVASVRARMAGVGGTISDGATDAVRERVPLHDRPRFDELLAELRVAYGLNDDDVGVTWSWPLGLVRRAVLEVGRRSFALGAVDHPDDVFEAEPDELLALLDGRGGPPASELRARSAAYVAAAHLDPPWVIGAPVDVGGHSEGDGLTPAVRRLVDAQQALWSAGPVATRAPLTGLGIGDTAYRGRACVIDGDGSRDLEPGDVIVATVTHAGHNTVFPIAGAVATEHGGLLSHPAVLARELGLPAVVGVRDLVARVRTGMTVDVDPRAGEVRIVD